MDKVADSVLVPWEHAASGGHIPPAHMDKADPEDICGSEVGACRCLRGSAPWQGALEAVMPHRSGGHKSIVALKGEEVLFLAVGGRLPGLVDWVTIQSCLGFRFVES